MHEHLAQKWDVSRNAALVGAELLAEARGKKIVFNPHTDFSSKDENH